MDKKDSYIELVTQAQLGDEKSMNRLAELARERLRVYVHRLALTDDVAEEILQESVLEMFRSIGQLDKADRFWPWLFRITANKVNRHYKRQKHRRTLSLSEIGYKGEYKDFQEDVAALVSQELKESVLTAMQELKPQQRNILILRCYEGLKYSEIAETIGCSEIGAQMRFLRAKKAMAKQLSRCGIGRGSLLMSLVLFGKMTAPSKAAATQISITASTMKVSAATSVAGIAASKTAVVSLVTAGVLTCGTMVATSGTDKAAITEGQRPSRSSYFTAQARQSSKGNEKCWYYYPSRSNGAVMLRLESDASGKQSYSLCLQNDKANYHKRQNTIYIENYRMWHRNLCVWRLPTDKPQLTDFLSRIEGQSQSLKYVSNDGDGLLVITKRDENNNLSQVTERYDVLDEEFFRYDWPKGTKTVDNRDAMHKRGWTYFRIAGQINEKQVYGTGRIPFVYSASQEYYPWLNLQMAGTEIEDADSFTGLPRPWMGLHTIDTVRRDAAEQEVLFDTKLLPDGSKAEVVLTYEQTKLG
jgi:RNA polymerase sigma-70 factor (ECF subfamily)